MSLLDDVSIVVTPNAYKASKLYAVLPTNVEGSELVTDGDFPTGSSAWNFGAGWSIANNKAVVDNASTTALTQSGLAVITGKKYNVSFEISDYVSGGFQFQFGGSQVVGSVNANGVYNFSAISTVNTTVLYLYATGDCEFKVDNVTCKQDTGADMSVTRATAATRVDENGLVNYAQVLSSEVVSCGNLECAAPNDVWNTGSNTTISGGKINSNSAGDYIIASQVPTPIILQDTLYKYTVEYTITSGSVRLGDSNQVWTGSTQSTSGTYTNIVTSSSSANGQIYFTSPSSDFVGSIDNISVKEVTRNNVPRIDYTGGGCPHILAEPQRTNLLPYSEDLSQWNLKQGTETLNYGISPDGTQNSTRIVFSGANLQFSNIFTTVTPTVGSIFIKGVNGETINFGLDSSEAIFTLNGSWQRFEKSGTSTSNKITINTFGGATARDIQVYGGQVEGGTYPTSYIPTSGSAVTRNQDVFTRDGISSLINSTEGVFFVEMAGFENDAISRAISLSDGTTSNRINLFFSSVQTQVIGRVSSGGVTVADMIYSSITQTSYNKIAVKWKLNDFALWVNGSEVLTDSSGAVPIGLNRLGFDNASTAIFFGKVKQLQVYKTALTDAQLTSLTS